MGRERSMRLRLLPLVAAGGLAVVALGSVNGAAGQSRADNEPSGPSQAGGGNLPGQRPSDGTARPGADAAPPLEPGFVDDYTRMWKQVERDKLKIATLGEDLVAADQVLAVSSSDLAVTMRERNRTSFALTDAESQFTFAVRDLYIGGTTDVDVVLGVLGSRPEDVLRNIDSLVYLRSATGTETVDYVAAQDSATLAESAAASAGIRADEDMNRVGVIRKELARTRARLRTDEKELQALVRVAAPQTVVSRNGCPKAVLDGTVPAGVNVKALCGAAVKHAATPQAATAIKWALVRLGAPYACEGIGRLEAWRFDCSSYVSRAFSEGAGLGTAGEGWAPSTRNMVPWDGVSLDQHYVAVPATDLHPGDLVLYDTCPPGPEGCTYQHVVLYLGPVTKGGVPMMAHTNRCGGVAHVEPFTGTDVANFLGVRRVMALAGERVNLTIEAPKGT